MAQRTIVQYVDDLDGTTSEEIQTVSFALDGIAYEIDLIPDNAAKLSKVLDEYIVAARRTSGRAKRGTAPKGQTPGASRDQIKAVRDWARQNGYELSDRGRIARSVMEAFEAAHAGNGKR